MATAKERYGSKSADDADEAIKHAEDVNKKASGKNDPADPAMQPGSTGRSATLGGGVKQEPTKEEDEEAKEKAKKTAEVVDNQGGENSYRATAQAEAKSIAEGNSLLGKEAVVVQDDSGNPIVARRGMPATEATRASATNPALAANNAIPAAPDKPPELPEGVKVEPELDRDGNPKPAPAVVTDLHGKGAQPVAG